MHESRIGFLLMWGCSMCVAVGVLYFLTISKNSDFSSPYRVLIVLALLVSHPIYSILNICDLRESFSQLLSRMFIGWIVTISALAIVGFVTKTSAVFSREVIILWMILGFVAQAIAFWLIYIFVGKLNEVHGKKIDSIVVGEGEFADRVWHQLKSMDAGGVDDKILVENGSKSKCPNKVVFKNPGELKDIVATSGYRKVFLVYPSECHSSVQDVYLDLLDLGVDIFWVPDVTQMLLMNHSIKNVSGMTVIHLSDSPLTSNPAAGLLKAALDKLLAILFLIILSPLLAFTALAVRLSSQGPIIFVQSRHGYNGKVFKLYKFRSLYVHRDASVTQVVSNDPRVTKVGHFIRRWSIDELPQLFNVLRGDMSLVGPRPHAVEHGDYYSKRIQSFMVRHRIKPGLTGLAQISGARGQTDTTAKMKERFELDMEYINNWSFLLDLKILIKTPCTIFSFRAY